MRPALALWALALAACSAVMAQEASVVSAGAVKRGGGVAAGLHRRRRRQPPPSLSPDLPRPLERPIWARLVAESAAGRCRSCWRRRRPDAACRRSPAVRRPLPSRLPASPSLNRTASSPWWPCPAQASDPAGAAPATVSGCLRALAACPPPAHRRRRLPTAAHSLAPSGAGCSDCSFRDTLRRRNGSTSSIYAQIVPWGSFQLQSDLPFTGLRWVLGLWPRARVLALGAGSLASDCLLPSPPLPPPFPSAACWTFGSRAR